MPSSDVIDMDKACHITNTLQEHALALHHMTLTQAVANTSDPRHLMSLGEMSGTHPSSSSSRNSLRSACMSAPTFINNHEHVNAVAFQHCEGVKEQQPIWNAKFCSQVDFMDDYS